MSALVMLSFVAQALSPSAFREVAARCAPEAPLATLRSIVAEESDFHPHAISLRHPDSAAGQLGLGEGSVALSRPARSAAEATRWARWFLAKGQAVRLGLMQLSVDHLAAFRLPLEQAFDPCVNLKIGWTVFQDKYRQASAVFGKGTLAAQSALAAYRSGSLIGGFQLPPPPDVAEEEPEPPPEPVVAVEEVRPPPEPEPPPPALPPAATPEPRTAASKLPWDIARAQSPWTPRKDPR